MHVSHLLTLLLSPLIPLLSHPLTLSPTPLTHPPPQDAVSVAEYYSSELVEFVRLVLEVIPVSVFEILSEIEKIQTHQMLPIPIRLEAKDLRDFAQLDLRFELSKLTHQVSIFTEGVLVMEKTLLGVVQVDPRQILQEGLRRELVRQIASAMHGNLIFRWVWVGLEQ